MTGKSFQKECDIIKFFSNEAITYWKIILLVVNHSRCAISSRLKPWDYGLNNIYFCTYTLTKHWRSICLESCSNILGWFFDCVQNFCCAMEFLDESIFDVFIPVTIYRKDESLYSLGQGNSKPHILCNGNRSAVNSPFEN